MIWTGILILALLVVGYYAFALLYHWLRYGVLYPMAFVALPIWAIGTVLILMISLAAYSAL